MAAQLVFGLIFTTLSIGLIYSHLFNIFNENKECGKETGLLRDGLSSYCESWRINVELNNIREFAAVPQECIGHIKHYMTSTQYQADSQKAVEEVKIYLSSCCFLKGDGKDAWIFDVDDTLLSTIPYFKKHHFGGDIVNKTSLEEWMKGRNAPAVEQSLEMFNEIRNSGYNIFIVSARSETLRSPTVDNLINVGYHGWSSLILRGGEDEMISVGEYKGRARKRMMEQGYRIWGIVGDQWSSITGPPYAKRTFKLPNSMYYVS
ncbi:acid phosphatase 1-like [Euphorbia lathyris]|uniref:acid phosphatase 1-like n=1 Tax=Euphorbia lathyris TaxID=212925 RepID=UPI003313A2DC